MRVIGWNIKSPLLAGKWPGWTVRRAKIVKKLATYQPDIFMGIEMGSPSHVRWLRSRLAKAGYNMAVADGGANWRYILYNPMMFRQHRGGQRKLAGAYKGDVKEMTWAQLRKQPSMGKGEKLAFVSHLEVDGPESNRLAQAKSMMSQIREIKVDLGVGWDDVIVYLDCNSDGTVQDYLEQTELSNLIIGARVKSGGRIYNTNNRWSKVRRKARANRSIDWLGAGERINATKVFSPDCSDCSDHNLIGADLS